MIWQGGVMQTLQKASLSKRTLNGPKFPSPLPKILECLAKKATRQPQKHSLDLLAETL
jgi:hypothetical protein